MLRSEIEARLLRIERALTGIDGQLAESKRQITQASQQVWDAWNDVGSILVPAPIAPEGVTAFPHVCPLLPLVMPLTDSVYGSFSLVWDEPTLSWTGCKLVSYGGNLACAPASSTPIHFTLFGDDTTNAWSLEIQWVSVATCPKDGATCGDTTNQSFVDTVTFNCHGSTTWGRPAGNIYPTGTTPNWTITIP